MGDGGAGEVGLPYWTLLSNGINHPGDRGHELIGRAVRAALVNYVRGIVDVVTVNLLDLG